MSLSPIARLAWFCAGWALVVLSSLAMLMAWLFPARVGSSAGWVVLASWIAAWGISTILHELAHLAVAHLFELNAFRVILGHGVTLWEGNRFGASWQLKAIPFSGMVYVLPVPVPHLRVRLLAQIGAGPLVHLLLMSGAGWFIWSQSNGGPMITAGQAGASLLLPMVLVNGWLLLSNLIPHHTSIDGSKFPNDGLQLFQLLRRSSAPLGAVGALDSVPDSLSWQELVASGHVQELLRQCRDCLNQSSVPTRARLYLLDVFATSVLMMGDVKYLDDADRYSKALWQARPEELSVMGTRGSVLIEKGELEAGIEMLTEVVERDSLGFDQAIAAAYIGLANIKQRRFQTASTWLAKAKGFDPECLPMKRFAKLLAQATLPTPDQAGKQK